MAPADCTEQALAAPAAPVLLPASVATKAAGQEARAGAVPLLLLLLLPGRALGASARRALLPASVK